MTEAVSVSHSTTPSEVTRSTSLDRSRQCVPLYNTETIEVTRSTSLDRSRQCVPLYNTETM